MVHDEVKKGRWMGNSFWKAAGMVTAVMAVLLVSASGALGAWIAPQRVSTGTSTQNAAPQIALDSSGSPSVVWYGNDGQIYYAKNTGSGWTPQLVSTGTSTGNQYPQIALDSSGNPSVVWNGTDGGGVGQVYYAKNTGSGWTPQKVSTGTSTINQYPQIALDSSGNPSVVWSGFDGSSWQVYYAKNTGSGWTPQKVSTGTSTGNLNPQLALDSSGNPSVVWYGFDGSNYPIYYAKNTGSGWTPQKVSTGTSTSNEYPQIALDSYGNPSVVWFGTYGGIVQIFYAENTGSGWTPQLVSTGTSFGNQYPQIALDSSGNPSVVWFGYDGSSYQVYYAENTGSGWTPQLVSTGTLNSNQSPQMMLDSSGNPSVVWYGFYGSSYQVYYAENTGSGWTPQLVSTGTSTDNAGPQVALDSSGNPSVVWYGDDGSTFQVYYSSLIAAPTVTTEPATSITSTGATLNGNITATGVENCDRRGFKYWKVGDTTWTMWAEGGSFGTGTFSHLMTGLDPATEYEFQAWAHNSAGDTYGLSGYFTTLPDSPTVNTTAPINITPTTADSGGNVTSDGGGTVTARGVCWSTSSNPTISDSHTINGSGTGTFTSNITGLTPRTQYHVRAYATNGGGTGYGSDLTFSTLAGTPAVSSISPTSGPQGTQVTVTGANFGAAQGGSTITVGGAEAPVISWSDTKIVITVPEGTQGGAVVVTTAAGGSNTDKTFAVTQSTWYLAEGTNAWGFNTYITIENPNTTAVHAKITYMIPASGSRGKGRVLPPTTIVLPPLSQTTISSKQTIGDTDFSTKVECLEGKNIAVDRTMFWTGQGYSKAQSGYHSSIGTTSPSKTWYLPEGSSNWGFETWTLVENPNSTAADVTLNYMTQDAGLKSVEKAVPAYSRASYNMAADIGNADSSVQVSSDIPVIAERSMYKDNRREGSCSIGATAPANDFYIAEGATGFDVGFTTYILVQNPNLTAADVTLTYQTQKGEVAGPSFTMQPDSRKTVRLNDTLPPGTDVSTEVHGSRPVVAEHAMYWDNGTGTAFAASLGLDSPHMSFMLPDGQTSNGAETWTLVENPNPGAVRVKINYLPQNGGTPVSFIAEIAPESRATFNMANKINSARASVLVQSLDGARPVMVERSMYFNNRGAGTNTIGGFSDNID